MLVYLVILLGMTGVSHQLIPFQINSTAVPKITLLLFRRTPEYASILEDRIDDLVAVVRETIEQGLNYHRVKFAEEAMIIAVRLPEYKLFPVGQELTDEEVLAQHMERHLRKPAKVRNDIRRRAFLFATKTADWCIESLSTIQ